MQLSGKLVPNKIIVIRAPVRRRLLTLSQWFSTIKASRRCPCSPPYLLGRSSTVVLFHAVKYNTCSFLAHCSGPLKAVSLFTRDAVFGVPGATKGIPFTQRSYLRHACYAVCLHSCLHSWRPQPVESLVPHCRNVVKIPTAVLRVNKMIVWLVLFDDEVRAFGRKGNSSWNGVSPTNNHSILISFACLRSCSVSLCIITNGRSCCG